MKTLVVANWKEHKTIQEASEWLEKFSSRLFSSSALPLEVVVCPSFVVLPTMGSEVSKLENIELGAQNVSEFEGGQYTGEVSAKMLKDFVSYVIVGHSERRRYFGETDEDVAQKIKQCLKHDLIPIVCISRLEQVSMCQPRSRASSLRGKCVNVSKKTVFAYEPLFAVGTGEPDTPENAQKFAEKLKAEVGRDVKVLYGGSVNAKNAKSFVDQPDINGVLVGEASLNAKEFAAIIDTLTR